MGVLFLADVRVEAGCSSRLYRIAGRITEYQNASIIINYKIFVIITITVVTRTRRGETLQLSNILVSQVLVEPASRRYARAICFTPQKSDARYVH